MQLRISTIVRDPQLKAIFEKAERDQGQTPAELDRKPNAPRLRDGAAVKTRILEAA